MLNTADRQILDIPGMGRCTPVMGAALSLLVILTLSILFIRVASVALRITGLPDEVARFQARSAFTGAGFTTAESEAIVNYPVRRRIVGVLMIVGNLGLVSVMAALILSFVNVEAAMGAYFEQIVWLVGVLLVLWIVILNPLSDRIMCVTMEKLLRRVTSLKDKRPITRLQVVNGYSVAEHRVDRETCLAGKHLDEIGLGDSGLLPIGIKQSSGTYIHQPSSDLVLNTEDVLVLYGADDGHAAFARQCSAEPKASLVSNQP